MKKNWLVFKLLSGKRIILDGAQIAGAEEVTGGVNLLLQDGRWFQLDGTFEELQEFLRKCRV